MQIESGWFARISWPLVRLGAWVVVVLVFGFAGVHTGIRAVGAMLLVFAVIQVARRFAGNSAGCEVSGQLSAGPSLLLAVVQVTVGMVMLGWPEAVLQLLGVEGL
jgi:flagellar biosynthesis protein FliR